MTGEDITAMASEGDPFVLEMREYMARSKVHQEAHGKTLERLREDIASGLLCRAGAKNEERLDAAMRDREQLWTYAKKQVAKLWAYVRAKKKQDDEEEEEGRNPKSPGEWIMMILFHPKGWRVLAVIFIADMALRERGLDIVAMALRYFKGG